MASQIILKKSSVTTQAPVPEDLVYGELALNYADGTLYYKKSDNNISNLGTVTSVAALTLGTSGTDVSSTVATGTRTPVITLNIPTASATNRGLLSAADWTAFNNKVSAAAATLATVTTNGNTTTNAIKVGGKSTIGTGPLTGSATYTLAVGQSSSSNVPTIAFSTQVIGDAVPETVIAKLLALDTSATTAMAGYASISLTSGIAGQLGKGQIIFHTSDETSAEANTNTMTEKVRIAYNGYLGVGTSTPTQRLEVAGTIYSTSGGFKFPDGTTQATAVTATGTNTGDQISLPNPNAITFASTGGAAAGSTYNGAAVLTVDYSTVGAAPSDHTHSYQAADNDLLAIGGLTGTSGYLKKTAADTWTLDTSTFITSIDALTIGTTGADVNSTVVPGTATVITLNIPTASATNRGALSSADWSTFNAKASTTTPTFNGLTTVAGVYANIYLTTYGSIFVDGTATNNILQLSSASRTKGGGLWSTGGNTRLYSADAIEFRTGVTLRDQDTPQGGANFAIITTAGNFGIGTAVPTQKLEVAGTIYSTAGGFKFPDGTTQITAATNSSGTSSGNSGTTYTRTTLIATAGQAVFNVVYVASYLQVFLNGVLLSASDYTATDGTSITLSTAASLYDNVEIISLNVAAVLPIASGGTGTATPALVAGTNVTITGTWPNQTINSTGGGGGTVTGTVSNITRTATGTGSQAAFTVTSGVTVDSVIVTENGVLQTPTTDYTVSGTTLTFTTAPASGVQIQIRELGSLGTVQESISPFMLMGA